MSSNIKITRICETCGNSFVARTTVTRYCSKSCNGKAYKNKKRDEKIEDSHIKLVTKVKLGYDYLKEKPFLTVSEAATLLGVSRYTIYNYLYNNKIKGVRLSERKTVIRNEDINKLFENPASYERLGTKEQEPITDFYTVNDITAKYNIKYRRIHEIVKRYNIPHQLKRNVLHISKEHIDKHLEPRLKENPEWYSVQEVCEIYNITSSVVYYYIKYHDIPKRKEGRLVFLSKTHVDEILNIESL